MRKEYELEELVRFGGGKKTQEANAAELKGLRAKAAAWDFLWGHRADMSGATLIPCLTAACVCAYGQTGHDLTMTEGV